ncbi:Trichodiene oxygenase [Cytospora mali]|uniref:Trichodiene oxygenase n=1 Tax=Cytospora mali TaxID=578113 RepID=A0A194VMZ2_CYTMA|nr:Trichodiene oxygenase [Valsa mali]
MSRPVAYGSGLHLGHMFRFLRCLKGQRDTVAVPLSRTQKLPQITHGYLNYPWVALTLATSSIVYFASLLFYRLFLHRAPGRNFLDQSWLPSLATMRAITTLCVMVSPIARISPYELHVNDSSYYEKLYRQDGRRNKYDWAYDAFGAPMPSICSVDYDLHKRRRTPLNLFFSKVNVASRQRMIQGLASKLSISAFTRDVATEFVLGKNYHNLDNENFGADMTNVLQSSGAI